MSSKQPQFKITVTQVRNRKPKAPIVNNAKKEVRQKLLEIMQNPDLYSMLSTPDLFVSVLSSAVSDLSE